MDRSTLTGVWIKSLQDEQWKQDKIAALGIHVNGNGRTSHGFSLNCDVDIDRWYSLFDPCGFKYGQSSYGVTSMSRVLNRQIGVDA